MTDVADAKTRHPDHHAGWNFPYAHVIWRMQDGSCLLVNEQNGNNSVLMQHGVSGSYTEINNSGDCISFTVGNKVDYNKSGVTLTVDNNGDMKITGHNRIMVGGGSHFEVAGDAGIVVGGDTAVVGMGKVNARAKSMYLASDGDIAMHASGKMDIQVKGDFTMNAANIKMNGGDGFGPGGGGGGVSA